MGDCRRNHPTTGSAGGPSLLLRAPLPNHRHPHPHPHNYRPPLPFVPCRVASLQKLKEALYGCARQQRSARGGVLFQAPQTITFHRCVEQCVQPGQAPLVSRDKFKAALSEHGDFADGGAAAAEVEMQAGERRGATVFIPGSLLGRADDVLCVDVPWLSVILQRTLSCPCETDREGCVGADDLLEVAQRCLPDNVPASLAVANLRQLASFGLIVPLRGGQRYLIPGNSAPQAPPTLPALFDDSHLTRVYRRRYALGGVPTGLWGLLVGRLLVAASTTFHAGADREFDAETAAAVLLSVCVELSQQLQSSSSLLDVEGGCAGRHLSLAPGRPPPP